jgi:hypothetical protein
MKTKIEVPKPSEERGDVESVSSFPQHGSVTESQPTMDAGIDSGVGSWSGDGPFEIRFEKA